MLTYKKLFDKPKKLMRLTSLTLDQFKLLADKLLPLWQAAEVQRLSRRERQRAIGAGRRYRLETMEDKLLCLLMHYRFYPTHDLLSVIFDLDPSNISRLVIKLTPLIEQAADPTLKDYLKTVKRQRKKIRSWDELVETYPDIAEAITDATEQQTRRPKAKRKQRRYYSGKKKRHTLKTQLTVSRTGRILAVSKTHPGSVHDKRVIDQEGTAEQVPKQTKHFLDRGYDGLSKDQPHHDIRLPYKRRRNKPELSRGEKQANTLRAKRRVLAENTIAKLKKYQVLSQVYRSAEERYNQTFRNISAITNFRLATAVA